MDVVALRDPVSSVVARFVPRAGMIGTSLRDGEVELLGQRRGLDAYVADGKTMGIPILYPWANRLGGNTYAAEGATVTLTPGRNGVRADPNGLPLHGVLAGYPGWRVTAQTANELTAQLDFGADPELLAGFPFPHLLQVAVRLAGRTLTLTTTVTATGDTAVPVCFGFHPYLQLPGVPRAEWVIETPPLRHLGLDDHGLPTGESELQPERREPLRDKTFDDAYDRVDEGAVFAVSGGGRRLEVCFEHGYPAAQIFAPPAKPGEEAVICFEPMTAPTDALRRGGYRRAHPGRPAATRFSIRV
ncbi:MULTISPECIES: aldose 1-epimerase [Mycobacterium avium complex (MAC)]|uniref:Aldose 1-epimerase n=1 Tax=Mycobacterium bouchedurhonense TaxID=701041 RepID=A0AAW5SC77_MYCBC|nr:MULTISPECIES: aldose 1-epimerase [Mycobacterium avium complex (MAC)]ETA90639.1 aldose 1-epimerase [Mycobacterium avium 05-4293]KDO93403.1 aldose 1-epimerase [Mycobacterium avium subsp. hominissuis 3388]MBZ4577099.1 aldose 1-epimerase [Mycobacterium avium subsp. hominissuis]MBZ4605166.1 aldose 1-epimerase [Mycobacterium avium subsp. hominissuis]MCV6992307.1 aldose 1-epimerase [Mycobacterium bouchedurhonense]